MPSLPTSRVVRDWIKHEMERRGLRWYKVGARICAATLIDKALSEHSFRDVNGRAHIQILADGVRVFRNAMMTNIGIRVLDNSDSYNSMQSMKLMCKIF